jgi:crossover junction endodeoxyribonuclease RuvC
MKILGLDPGSYVTGYGVIETDPPRVVFVSEGVLESRARSFPDRLMEIAHDLEAVLVREEPDVVVVEDVFSARNVRTSFRIAEVRGVLILTAARSGKNVVAYSPAEIKRAVVGNGAAAKEQVQYMVRHLLNLRETPSTDAADALAAALCHSRRLSPVGVEAGAAGGRRS